MTRNEYIAETAARFAGSDSGLPDIVAVTQAIGLADALESAGVAPWHTTPATDTAAKVVDAAVAWQRSYVSEGYHTLQDAASFRLALNEAVKAHLAAQGGAK